LVDLGLQRIRILTNNPRSSSAWPPMASKSWNASRSRCRRRTRTTAISRQSATSSGTSSKICDPARWPRAAKPAFNGSGTEERVSQVFEGAPDARGLKFALVVARFNELFTEQLLSGAFDCLRRHGAAPADLHVVRVPGSFEVPLAAKTAAETGRYDAVVCIAAVVRGATPHFDLVANEVASGVAQAILATGLPL